MRIIENSSDGYLNMNSIVNAITIDVEDYYQVEAFAGIIDRRQWPDYSSRVFQNNEKILKIFDNVNIKGTFFVLGSVAEKNPSIVKEIVSQGHEVACHGYSHKMIMKQSRAEFKEETLRAKELLENITGEKVKGYRAATYSITKKNLWALEVLMEAGFEYDSSIFPIRHDRYGISDFNREPCLIVNNDQQIKEFPISTKRILTSNFPVAGGGYFRLYPYVLSRWGLSSVNAESMPFVFYIHPWELDPGQPRIKGISAATRFRHYINLDRTEGKLRRLLSDFNFDRMDRVLDKRELPIVDLAAI